MVGTWTPRPAGPLPPWAAKNCIARACRVPMGEMVQGKYVQIVAKVDHNNTLEALRLTDMNSNFDMGVYSKALQMMASPLCAQLFT